MEKQYVISYGEKEEYEQLKDNLNDRVDERIEEIKQARVAFGRSIFFFLGLIACAILEMLI